MFQALVVKCVVVVQLVCVKVVRALPWCGCDGCLFAGMFVYGCLFVGMFVSVVVPVVLMVLSIVPMLLDL